jgi:hypothetical protein
VAKKTLQTTPKTDQDRAAKVNLPHFQFTHYSSEEDAYDPFTGMPVIQTLARLTAVRASVPVDIIIRQRLRSL